MTPRRTFKGSIANERMSVLTRVVMPTGRVVVVVVAHASVTTPQGAACADDGDGSGGGADGPLD